MKETKPFMDWAIVSDGRVQYLGKVVKQDGMRVHLEPAYEWLTHTGTSPHGEVTRSRLCLPLEMLQGANELVVEATTIIDLDGVTDADCKVLNTAVKNAENLRSSMRGDPRIVLAAPTALHG